MKLKSILLVGMLCTLASTSLFAQLTVTLGDVSTNNNIYPFRYSGTGAGRYQTAYSAAELGMTGGAVISEVRIKGNSAAPGSYNLAVNVGYTASATNALTSNFDTNFIAASKQTVLTSTSYTPAISTGNWAHFVFSTPFVYDGTSTLLLEWVITSRTGAGFQVSSSTPASPLLTRSRVWNQGGPTSSTGSSSSTSGNMGITFLYTQGLTVTTPANLPAAGEGTTYSRLIQADWGVTGYTWSLDSGTLPNGMSLSASGNNYLLSGTPTVGSAGTYNFTVRVVDSDTPPDNATKAMVLVVEGLKVVNANPLPDGKELVAYNQTFTATNGPTPYTWSLKSGSLPAGLSLSQSGATYQLTGTPSAGATGNYTFEVEVRDNNNSTGAKTFNLYIDWPVGALTYPCTEQNPATTGFGSSTSGNQQHGWRFTCNSGGISVIRLGSNMPAAAQGIAKTVTLFDFTSQAILGQVTVGPGAGWQWQDLVSPILLSQGSDYIIAVHTTNGYYLDSTAQASWIPTGDIQYVARRYSSTTSANTFPTSQYTGSQMYGVCDFGYIKGLTITTDAQMPSGAEGIAYNTPITADYGTVPYTWSLQSGTLPTGLTLTQSGNDFLLSGTPPTGAVGPYNFTVRVTDDVSDTFDKNMSLYISPPPASMPFSDDFTTNSGWQLDTGWEMGPAVAYNPTTGIAREEPGDDTSPSTDKRILGHMIGADYPVNMTSTVWATSPPIDCSSAVNVGIRFQRFTGVTLGHTAKIQVTNNGSVWNDVTPGYIVQDTAWTFVGEDITQWAAGHAVVQVRIGIGPTDSSANLVNTGWCIDDFQVLDPGPALEVEEGPTPVATITDDQTVGGLRDFGQVTVNTASNTLDITFTNNGTTDIDLDNINGFPYEKVGANPGDFTVIQNPGWTITPGNSTVMRIQFYRTTAGVSTCTINVGHDATGAGTGTTPFEINLRGEAIVPNPLIQVDLVGTPNVNIPHQDPVTGTPRDFGNVNVGQSSTPITIEVTNVGNSDLLIQQIVMSGLWNNQYSVNTPAIPATLGVSQTLTFTVAFQPLSNGQKDAFVRITHNGNNATGSPEYEVPVTGVGVTPTVNPAVSVNDGAGNVTENAAPAGNRDFGSVSVGSNSTVTTITVSNTGGGVMTVGMPVLAGPDAGEFSLSNTAGFGPTIAVSASATFDITFSPTSVGTKVATVSFTHDDPTVNTPFVINITGDGTALFPVMEVRETNAAGSLLATPAPASGILNFGTQAVTGGPSANVAVIYVENLASAAADLTLGTPVFNPTGNTEFSIDTTNWSSTLTPGNSASFSITFDPTQSGQLIGLIEFTHNDTTSGSPFVLNVTGNGTTPVVEAREGVGTTGTLIPSSAAVVTGGGRDLGSIDVSAGATAAKTITIVNAGTLSLTVGTPTLAGIHAADFTLNTGGMSGALAPAASTSFTVTFDPTVAGMKDAEVRFTHNDTTQPSPFIVRIRGTATDPSAVQITTLTLPPATLGQVYPTTTMTAIQGAAPYTWSVYSGALPTGLTLSTAGVISGTPTIVGSYTFIIRVTDGGSITNERQYNVVASGSVINLGGGGGNAGCSANTGGSNVWIALLALLAIGAVIFRRKETA